MSIRSVLVTGSSGMIGTALTRCLHADGYDVYGADVKSNPWDEELDAATEIVDLREREALRRLPTDVDAVVHLAAHSHVRPLVERPEGALENVTMTFNVLEFARKNDIQNVLFASSREVYGEERQLVYDEANTQADRGESPYAASKIGGEAMVTAFSRSYGITTSIARFANVYGRFDVSNRVIPLFIARSRDGRELAVYGAEKLLDFVFIDDCVDGLFRMIDNHEKVANATVNIASGRGTSLLELAQEIDERTPRESEIVVEPSRTGETSRFIADVEKARRILGYEPEYDLGEGLDETIPWYLDRPSALKRVESYSDESAF
ncbi:NAD-dependent epimerase/dehydratase family protein [Natronococcus occultus]|uniref:Nucleoside-diphosphate-sugar epimerase n=1 Tax=Natronococcus occultus SP4 TaxID=694430 RepID=L0K5B6_9EURY|nr:NAD-dependent epimerase/dehydratase family protein [Natronococcus occultus]AGB39283.1 nucleoside-diphosphate-sugar epimerase [Natronococcus occultus SP4]